ncbi:glycosyltransferase [Porticoccaceae bacterium]|nr:glycosyltransferase [Porticoccaceae bacterium]
MNSEKKPIEPFFDEVDNSFCSVIIVCKDNLSEVKSTILSVLSDGKMPIGAEIIIVDDSANSDIAIFVESFQMETIRHFRGDGISLYSAMNIGIKSSHGKYLWFLNSGDFKSDEFAIDSLESETADIIYGNTSYIKDDVVIYNQTRPSFKLLKTDQLDNSLPCHQSILFRRRFVIRNKVVYDIKLKISGDYKFLETLIDRGASILYRPITISRFTLGGISNRYKNLRQVISHAKEIKVTRNLSKFQSLLLTLKLCRKLSF